MSSQESDPAITALQLVRVSIEKAGIDVGSLFKSLENDLYDDASGSSSDGMGHEYRRQVLESLIAAGYEQGNG